MEWVTWFFLPDAWLSAQIFQGETWESMFLAIASSTLGTIKTILIFVFLIFISKNLKVQPYLRRYVDSALSRREKRGQKMAERLARWRYRYVFIFALNIIPYIPWVTAATVFYGVILKDMKVIVAVLAGLAAKAAILTLILGIARSLING